MTVTPPLFLQTGEYPASADRYSIGALLSGSGDEVTGIMRPLIGVRPIGVVSTPEGMVERSLRVSLIGSTITIDPGAAFVPSGSLSGINGVYLVIAETPIEIPLPARGPTTMQYGIHMVVYDPEDTEGGGDEGSTMWEVAIFDSSVIPPASSLPLGSVSIPPAGAPTVGDLRMYSTSMGGVYVSPSSGDLLGRSMPVGTIGYIRSDRTLWIREPDKWAPMPVVVNSDTTTFAERQGELRWDNLYGQLQVTYMGGNPQAPTWGEVGHLPHQARTGYATSWPLLSSSQSLTPVGFWALMNTPNSYYMIRDAAMVDIGGKPTQPQDRRDAEVQCRINSRVGVAAVTVSASVNVMNNTDYAIAAAGAYIALACQVYVDPPEGEVAPPGTPINVLDVNFNGLMFYGDDVFKSRTVFFNLSQGQYLFRPMFLITVAGAIEVSNLTLAVSVHG